MTQNILHSNDILGISKIENVLLNQQNAFIFTTESIEQTEEERHSEWKWWINCVRKSKRQNDEKKKNRDTEGNKAFNRME